MNFNLFCGWLLTVTKLQHLAINVNQFQFEDTVKSFTVPTLLSLEFSLSPRQNCDRENLSRFCYAINTPFLTTLIFTNFSDNEMTHVADILCHNFQHPTLRSLILRDSGFPEYSVSPSFLANIRELVFTGSRCLNLLQSLCLNMEQMASAAPAFILWPDLRDITVKLNGDEEALSLCALVSSRAAYGHPLGSIRLLSVKGIDLHRLECLRERVEVDVCQ